MNIQQFDEFSFIDDLTIPVGTEFVMDIWSMHTNSKYWKYDAQEFNPDNFASGNTVEKHAYAYLPFGGGPRNCIG